MPNVCISLPRLRFRLKYASVGGANASHRTVPDDSTPTITQLQQEIDSAHSRIADLEHTYAEQVQLQEQYKETLAQVTQLIQSYHENVQKHAAALHKHYGDLLQQSRQETIEAQMTHQEWQAGLKRYSETVREAFRAREEEGRPYKARIAALKEENRMLRLEIGWDPPVDSDEDEWDEEDMVPEEGRGRGSRSSQPTAGPGDRQGGLILPFSSGGDKEDRQGLPLSATTS
jgi:gas vesicle protein